MMAHPIQAVQEMAGAAGADPRAVQRSSTFQGLNEGPAAIASKITGVVSGGKRVDDAPYHTNNDGIPWPDPTHSKTVGGIPVASDIFLFQKQQAFNRHKLLERMVHPCRSILI
jgi:catalase